jgi:hypothetical protein
LIFRAIYSAYFRIFKCIFRSLKITFLVHNFRALLITMVLRTMSCGYEDYSRCSFTVYRLVNLSYSAIPTYSVYISIRTTGAYRIKWLRTKNKKKPIHGRLDNILPSDRGKMEVGDTIHIYLSNYFECSLLCVSFGHR